MLTLSADERDAVTELMNIGVGRSAAAFSRMLGTEVQLSVPTVEVVTRKKAVDLIATQAVDRMTGIRQQFDGPFSGSAALVFPEPKSLELVRAVLGTGCSLEEITELEQETLLEIGNIILNACLATLANLLKTEVIASLPSPLLDACADMFDNRVDNRIDDQPNLKSSEAMVMFLHIKFSVRSHDISGYLVFFMNLADADKFFELIHAYVGSFGN